MSRYKRPRETDEEQRTTNLELFFDLVFVFAITQISQLLLTHLTWEGVGQSALVLLVVWWSWNYTTWVTNELDPESIGIRLLLIGLMLATFVMAIAIPGAFGDRALLFAGAYVASQVGRHTFLAFVANEAGTIERERAGRALTWFCAAGVLWIAGGIVGGTGRTVLWLGALLLDYGAPVVTYWVPGRPRIGTDAWQVETGHFAERFQLFVIIALGESIVITGVTTSRLDLDALRVVAFALAFLGTASLWWLYFNSVAHITARELAEAADRTALARDAYTYLHVLMIAGVIVTAVGDELVIAHPSDPLTGPEVAAVVAGPVIYLFAQLLFRLRTSSTFSRRRSGGAAACVLAGLLAADAPAVVLLGLVVSILVVVIAFEQRAVARRRAAQAATG
jgi:low temperature requirement protein LtrA